MLKQSVYLAVRIAPEGSLIEHAKRPTLVIVPITESPLARYSALNFPRPERATSRRIASTLDTLTVPTRGNARRANARPYGADAHGSGRSRRSSRSLWYLDEVFFPGVKR